MLKSVAKVEIIDAYKEDLNRTQLYTRLSLNKPNVVGITMMIDQHLDAAKYAARVVKSLSPDIKVIVGGASATVNAEELIESPSIDVVIKGEGEGVIQSAVSNPSNKKLVEPLLHLRLDTLPRPNYSLINLKSYISNPPIRKSVDSPRLYPYMRVITSRGCPYGCCFCQVEHIMGKMWRCRSVDNVLDEIAWLKRDYGIKSLVFDDDNLLYDTDRAKYIFRGMIHRDLAMPWSMIATAVNKIDSEMVKLMKRSGCKYVNVAIESGVDRVLKDIIHKPITLTSAKSTVYLLQSHGIFVAANFIVGFPGETWQEIRETLDYADWFNADYTKIFNATPLKHTRLWRMCKESNCMVKGDAWREGQIETNEFTPQELTILRAYEWDRINFTNPNKRKRIAWMMGVTEGELDVIRKDTRRRVYGSN